MFNVITIIIITRRLRRRLHRGLSGGHRSGPQAAQGVVFCTLSVETGCSVLYGVDGCSVSYCCILQRGVQWKQGVVFCTVLCTILLYNTTPIHCTPLPLHPPPTAPPSAEYPGTAPRGTIPSKHSTPQDLLSPCLNLTDSARTMLTPAMFSRRQRWRFTRMCC